MTSQINNKSLRELVDFLTSEWVGPLLGAAVALIVPISFETISAFANREEHRHLTELELLINTVHSNNRLAWTGFGIALFLLIYQFIQIRFFRRQVRAVRQLTQSTIDVSAKLESSEQDMEVLKFFYRRSDEAIGGFVARRDKREQYLLQMIANKSRATTEERVAMLDNCRNTIDELIKDACETVCVVLSYRKQNPDVACASNVKLFFKGKSGNPRYKVIARSESLSKLREAIDLKNGSGRFYSKNYFFKELFSPTRRQDIQDWNDIGHLVLGNIGDFEEPSLRTSQVYTKCIMAPLVDTSSDARIRQRADDRTDLLIDGQSYYGVLTIDSLEVEFDSEFDHGIVREMAIYISSAVRAYDLVVKVFND